MFPTAQLPGRMHQKVNVGRSADPSTEGFHPSGSFSELYNPRFFQWTLVCNVRISFFNLLSFFTQTKSLFF